MRTHVKVGLVLALAGMLAATSGCIIRREAVEEPASSRTQTTTESVPLGAAKQASMQVSMGAGELTMSGADLGADVLRGEFTFAPARLEPVVTSELGSDSETINVTVSHPDIRDLDFLGRNVASEWSLQLAAAVPMDDVNVSMGAGNADLNFKDVDLSRLQVDMGAGDLMLDLSGPRTSDVTAAVAAGAGLVEVRLPKDVGVRVSGRNDGIGEWSHEGFTVDGDYLVNDAYGTSETTIELDVQRGIGEVRLVLVD